MSETPSPAKKPTPRRIVAGVLLVLPFVVYLAVPSYAKVEPKLAGFPFFYWWQLLWVLLTAACIGTAHRLTRRKDGAG